MTKENSWQLQTAKAQFSYLVDLVEKGDSIKITRHGYEVAVLISKKKYDSLMKRKSELLNCLLSSPYPELDLDITRSKEVSRDIEL